jgi:hypothetical protein
MSGKFEMGRIVSTPNALSKLTFADIHAGIKRHEAGDWGDVNAHDGQANESALGDGTRIWSVYRSITGVKFWIITEADRSATTVLLPEDY